MPKAKTNSKAGLGNTAKKKKKQAGDEGSAPPGGKGAAAATGTAASSALLSPPHYSWPPFHPKLPISVSGEDGLLGPAAVVVPDMVVVYRRFFPRSLCREYVAFLRGLPLATTPGGQRPRPGEAVRVNDRFQVEDGRFAARLWAETGLREAILARSGSHSYDKSQDDGAASQEGSTGGLGGASADDASGTAGDLWGGEVVGLNANIRVYRYTPGQFFACHYDDSNLVTVTTPAGEQVPARTTWTLLLYLTSAEEGCLGGATVFHPSDNPVPSQEIAVEPETGMLLLHKHGHDCMLHEGRQVTQGEKWILRTDLCVRR